MTDQDTSPWYRRAVRWGQTNITELDPTRYDIDWWRDYWRRTRVQGVIINAGGIVAYYPSSNPLQYRAEHLGDRDLFGDVAAAAKEDGLAVLARMDSNRATEAFFQRHPDWFTRDRNGTHYKAGDRFVACIHSDYYDVHLTGVLREIIERYQPDGFTDNSWSGLGRSQICYCENCQRSFQAATGYELPTGVDWDDPAYRAWIRWNYDRRLEVWDMNNRVTQEAGGPDCLWLGMINGNVYNQALRLRDHKAICERCDIIMLDYQARNRTTAFHNNGDAGKMLHGLAGWDTLIPESMAQYQGVVPTFRVASKPQPEVHMWMVEGFAGTIQPWWHFISAYHEDRRQYQTPVSLLQWHAANERYLVNRRPVASVGVLWSQENVDFYGRENGQERVMLPYDGTIRALIRARIPYVPIHADHVGREASNLATLILPNLAAMSDAQVQSVRDFVERGGSLIATGQSSLYNEWGDRRDDFALADLFAAHATGEYVGHAEIADTNWEQYEAHSYLRLHPEWRGRVDGPKTGDEPAPTGERPPVLHGFDETDILPFGGRLELVNVAGDGDAPLTWIPQFPIYPPEFAWMREPDSGHAALVLRTTAGGGRTAYVPADIDRCFGRYNLPDHGDLLANIVHWATPDPIPLQVSGPGLIDCHLYQQPGRLILHLVNLTATGHVPMHEQIPVGPLQVEIELPNDVTGRTASCLVSEETLDAAVEDGWVRCEVPSVAAHEVIVVE